jgi:hypothetical protein
MTAIADPGATGSPPRHRPLLRLAGIGLGISAGWLATTSLSPVYAAVLTSLLLAGGASLAGGLNLSRQRFWLLIGAAVGGVLGTAQTLAEKAHAISPAANLQGRLLTVGMLALAGSMAGFCLGRDAQRADRRHPRDLLRSASALTTGLFALLVTLTFLHQGLEGARSFSSRLSTTLTIIVTAVVVPGWLSQQWRARAHSLPPPAGGRR